MVPPSQGRQQAVQYCDVAQYTDRLLLLLLLSCGRQRSCCVRPDQSSRRRLLGCVRDTAVVRDIGAKMGSCAASKLRCNRQTSDGFEGKPLTINNNQISAYGTRCIRMSHDSSAASGRSCILGSDVSGHGNGACARLRPKAIGTHRDMHVPSGSKNTAARPEQRATYRWDEDTVMVLKCELIRRRRIRDNRSVEHLAAECVALAIVNATKTYSKRTNGEA